MVTQCIDGRPQEAVVPALGLRGPQAHVNAVERKELLERIFLDGSRVVVFQGPAGHGKTSLMLQARDLCIRRGWAAGWLSLNGSDNDLNRFLQHFRALIREIGEHAANSGSKPGFEVEEGVITSTSDWVLSQILQIGCPVAIFLDDLHDVTGRATLTFLRAMLANAPGRIRWFLASRSVPEIGLPRMVVGDQALVIQATELRFTRAELARFFSLDCSPPLNESELDRIFEATEGWPAASQLYRLALRSQPIRASLLSAQNCHLREMSGYLVENVLTQQEAHLQTFLVKTSILERMSPQQCNELLDRTDSAEVLDDLERIGLFVRRLDPNEDCFSYHALFSKFLQEQLAATFPEQVIGLHVRAANWYRRNGRFEESLHHFLIAGDYDSAGSVFDEWAGDLILDGFLATVDHWATQVPVEELAKFPGLVTKVVWALAFLGRNHKLKPLLSLLKSELAAPHVAVDQAIAFCMVSILEDDLRGSLAHLEGIDPKSLPDERFRAFGLSAAANAKAYAAMCEGNYEVALELLTRGRVLSEHANATFTLAYSLAKTGIINFSQGYLREALVSFHSAMSDSRMYITESVSKACLACAYIMALYEADDTEGALEQFAQYRQMIEDAGLHDYLVVCYRAIARIHDKQGRPDDALQALEVAERRAFSCGWSRVINLINWERVRREVLAGNLDRARSIAERIEKSQGRQASETWISFSEESEDASIGLARLLIHDGRHDQALKLIQRALNNPSVGKRVVRKIKLHLLAAMAWQTVDDNHAQRSMCLALELAAPGGYLRAFLDEGPKLVQLAHKCLRLQADLPKSLLGAQALDFLSRIVEVSGARAPGVSYLVQQPFNAHDTGSIQKSLAQGLTKKEAKILSMLTAYMSNEQIAAALFVSRDTVKYHIKNIYGKLGASNRLEAIRMAIDLGLTPDQ